MTEIPPRPGPSPAIIADATRRTGLVWIAIPGHGRPRPAWHIWRSPPMPAAAPGAGHAGSARGGGAASGPAGAAYVLTGPGEQPLPGLDEATRVAVIVRSSQNGGRAVTWTAEVSRVEPGGAEWNAVIGQLLAGRLNAATAAGQDPPAQRWAATGAVYRLTPTDR